MCTRPTCQRVKEDHLPLQVFSPPFPTPCVGVASSSSTSSNFRWLAPATTSCRCILILTSRVWLVRTFKTATAETAARNFVVSVFLNAGLPDVLVLDSDMRCTSAFWTARRACTAVHAALGMMLIFGSQQSQHHHNTTSNVECINDVIADADFLLIFFAPLQVIDAMTGRTSCRSLCSP